MNILRILTDKPVRFVYISLIMSIIVHIPFFGLDLIGIHVWRQSLTQLNIQNFAFTDFNILHPTINNLWINNGLFPTDFPLMQWMVACLYKIFGDHLIITRLSMFVQCMIMIFGMYNLIYQLSKSRLVAGLVAYAFTFAPIIFYYGINPMPDNLALCLAVYGLLFVYKYKDSPSLKNLILSVFFIGLSTLIKLPFILFYIPLGWIFLQQKKIIITGFITILSLIPALSWYSYVIPYWKGNGIVEGMTGNLITFSEIIEICNAHLISFLPELYINYLTFPFFLIGLFFAIKRKIIFKERYLPILLLLIGCFAYFLFEINMIKKEHDYYMFPFLIPTFILIGFGFKTTLTFIRSKKLHVLPILMIVTLLTPVTAYIRVITRWDLANPGCNRDLFDNKIAFQNATPKDALCVIGNDLSRNIYFYHLQKKGFSFENDNLSPDSLRSAINRGAEYLYSDSRKVDTDPQIKRYLSDTILVHGKMKLYSLRK